MDVSDEHKLTDLACRDKVKLIGDSIPTQRGLAAALPVAYDRNGSLGESFYIRIVVLDHKIAECRRYDEIEQSRVCDEQQRSLRFDEFWYLEVITLGRFEQPSPICPVLIHYRV